MLDCKFAYLSESMFARCSSINDIDRIYWAFSYNNAIFANFWLIICDLCVYSLTLRSLTLKIEIDKTGGFWSNDARLAIKDKLGTVKPRSTLTVSSKQ